MITTRGIARPFERTSLHDHLVTRVGKPAWRCIGGGIPQGEAAAVWAKVQTLADQFTSADAYLLSIPLRFQPTLLTASPDEARARAHAAAREATKTF